MIKKLNNSNCKIVQTHFNDSKINKIHSLLIKLLN